MFYVIKLDNGMYFNYEMHEIEYYESKDFYYEVIPVVLLEAIQYKTITEAENIAKEINSYPSDYKGIYKAVAIEKIEYKTISSYSI